MFIILRQDEEFDSVERPINVDESNFVWVNQPGSTPMSDRVKLALLWGTQQTDQIHLLRIE